MRWLPTLLTAWLWSQVWADSTTSPSVFFSTSPTSPSTTSPTILLTSSPTIATTSSPTIATTSSPTTSLPTTSLPTATPSAVPTTHQPSLQPTSSAPQTFAPSRVPTTAAPTTLPIYCDTPTDLNTPGRVRYSTFAYPTSFQGCQWNVNAGAGKVASITIQSFISVALDHCDNYHNSYCLSYVGGECSQRAIVATCNLDYPCLTSPALQFAYFGISIPTNATAHVCPRLCSECESCNYNYVVVTDSTGMELFRSCGNSSAPVTFTANTPDVTVKLVRGYLQQLNCKLTNTSCIAPFGEWATSPRAELASPLGPSDYVDFTWSAVDPVPETPPPCDGVVEVSDPGVISTGGLGHYANNANCTWIITAPPNMYVSLRWTRFNLQPSFDAKTRIHDQELYANYPDYVLVRDGTSLRGPFAGTVSPGSITSVTNSFEIYFQSDNALTDMGFVVEYDFVSTPGDGPHFCSGNKTLNIAGTVIQDRMYPPNSQCKWTIVAPNDQFVKIDWNSFSVEGSFAQCVYLPYDYVEVRTPTGMVLQHLCGTMSRVPSVTSLTNRLEVTFYSDAFVPGNGFSFNYSFVSAMGQAPSSCLVTQTINGAVGSSGFIEDGLLTGKTPGPPPRVCNWLIRGPAGSHVHFTFVRVRLAFCADDLEAPGNNAVSIYDGQDLAAPLLQSSCLDGVPLPTESVSNQIVINLIAAGGDDGFLGYYEIRAGEDTIPNTPCSGVKTITSGNSGNISDGNEGLGVGSDCTWRFTAPQGKFVQLQILRMAVGVGVDGCNKRWIGGFDGTNESTWPFFSTCGVSIVPGPLSISTSQEVLVRFVDVDGAVASSFQIEWKFVSTAGDHSAHCWNEVQPNAVLGSTTTYTPVVLGEPVGQPLSLAPYFRRGLWCAWKVHPVGTQILQIKWQSIQWSGVRTDLGQCGDYVQITSDPSLVPNPDSNYMFCLNANASLGPVLEAPIPLPNISWQFTGDAYVRMMLYQDFRFALSAVALAAPVAATDPRDTSAGLIVGVTVLVVLGLCGIVGLGCYCSRRKQHSSDPSDFDLGTGQHLGNSPTGASSFDFGSSQAAGHQRMHSDSSV